MEIWKDIKGYEGSYQVSNMGDVRSLDRIIIKSDGVILPRKGKMITKIANPDGYYMLKLSKNNISKTCRVHRLVLSTFSPNDIKGMEVNHIDFDRKNNKLENLEWKTHIENVRHSSDQGRYGKGFGEKNPNFGGTALKEKFEKYPELKMLQSRPGEQNGRAKKVILYDIDKNVEAEFNWIGGCAEYMVEQGITSSKVESLRATIYNCAKEDRPYKGHYFEIVAD